MKFRVVIPARLASTRLPGKPLLDIAGKPMIQHVYERAVESGAEQVIIAVEDPTVQSCAEGFAAEVCMTSTEHRSGTDRLAEVVEKYAFADDEIIVNVQGDEPQLPPALIRQVAQDLDAFPGAGVATLAAPIHDATELFDPNAVKVVMDAAGYALYFSRAPIPWSREHFTDAVGHGPLPAGAGWYRHIGIYAYRCGFLRRYSRWSPVSLEQTEALEQLRVLVNGDRIHVSLTDTAPQAGVDTPTDLERVRRQLGTARA